MPDLFNLTEDMRDYFDTLPAMVQESIMQSGTKINSLEDLKEVAKNIQEESCGCES